MSQYTFVVCGGISLHVDVEADSLEDAIAKAQQAATISLCHQCARGSEGEWSTSGELDCEPASSELVEVFCDEEDVTEKAKEHWS